AQAPAGALADGRPDRRCSNRAGSAEGRHRRQPNGKIVTTDSEIVIQPVETAIVRSIAVRMGQQVKAGDVLATLDPTFSLADRDELVAKLRNLSATYDRLDAELAGRAYDPTNPTADELTQRDVFRKRQAEYAAKLGAAERKT